MKRTALTIPELYNAASVLPKAASYIMTLMECDGLSAEIDRRKCGDCATEGYEELDDRDLQNELELKNQMIGEYKESSNIDGELTSEYDLGYVLGMQAAFIMAAEKDGDVINHLITVIKRREPHKPQHAVDPQ